MNIKKLVLTIGIVSLTSFGMVESAYAGTSCQPIYGGGQTCTTSGNLLINKQVLNPSTNQMVESLGFNDPRYRAENIITFKIILTNSGSTALQNIQVQDSLPQYVNFMGGSVGINVDKNNKKRITYSVANLNPGQSQSVTLQAKVVSSGNLPQQVTCQENKAIAVVGDDVKEDNAGFCIEKSAKKGKQVFPPPSAKTTPPTGPEAFALLSLIPTGVLGVFLRKRSIS